MTRENLTCVNCGKAWDGEEVPGIGPVCECGSDSFLNDDDRAMIKMGQESLVARNHRLINEARAKLSSSGNIINQNNELTQLREYKDKAQKAFYRIEQTLGKALGNPWYKDDQKNFPGATEADGVCVGDSTAESLAEEAANKLSGFSQVMRQLNMTCDKCPDKTVCECAWDLYNVNGECLRDK